MLWIFTLLLLAYGGGATEDFQTMDQLEQLQTLTHLCHTSADRFTYEELQIMKALTELQQLSILMIQDQQEQHGAHLPGRLEADIRQYYDSMLQEVRLHQKCLENIEKK